MTATTFSRLPLLAGSAVAASLGRVGLWTLSRYMRAPLASTGMLAMVTLTALAASNALYFQTQRHPAPFFSPAQNVPLPVALPLVAPQPEQRQVMALPAVPAPVTTGSVTTPPQVVPVVPTEPVGNKDAFAVQKKLLELGLFNGKVDGFYGPMTASAIRSFETRNGLTPTGALTPAVIDAILRSDSSGRAPAAAQVAPQPAPVQPVAQAAPAQTDVVVAQIPTLSPVDTAVDTIGAAAANTIDTIVAAVDGTRSAPPSLTTNAPVPAAPLPARPQASIQVASLEPMAPPAPVAVVQPEPTPQQTLATVAPNVLPANNVQLVSQIQQGLASLGFYRGPVDGHPGDATARAIREFENFHSYKLTGQVNPDLVGLLRQAGAAI